MSSVYERAKYCKFGEIKHRWEELFEATFGEPFGDNKLPPDGAYFLFIHGEGSEDEIRSWVVGIPEMSGDFMYLAWGGVLKQFQCGGFVVKYLNPLYDFARALGIKRVSTLVKQANIDMQRIHLKMGFWITGVIAGRDGRLEIQMQKALG